MLSSRSDDCSGQAGGSLVRMRGGRAAGDDDVPGKGGNRMARRPRKMSAPHIFDACYGDKQAPGFGYLVFIRGRYN